MEYLLCKIAKFSCICDALPHAPAYISQFLCRVMRPPTFPTRWLAAVLAWAVAIFALATYLSRTLFYQTPFVWRLEPFQDEGTTQKRCFECMTYFQDVLGLPDSAKIADYVKQRAEYLTTLLTSLKAALAPDATAPIPCKTSNPTAAEWLKCFQEFVATKTTECQNAKQLTPTECAVVAKLGDDIARKAAACGAKDCSIEELRTRLGTLLDATTAEIEECRKSLDNPGAVCTATYAAVIDLKTKGAAAQEVDASAPITTKQLRDEMGRMATFAMTMS